MVVTISLYIRLYAASPIQLLSNDETFSITIDIEGIRWLLMVSQAYFGNRQSIRTFYLKSIKPKKTIERTTGKRNQIGQEKLMQHNFE